MIIDHAKIKALDKAHVYESIGLLPDQIEQVLDDARSFVFPESLQHCDNIAISGMGGSIYNYYVLQSLFADTLDKPLIMINGYDIPASVTKDTLVIGSSYSGSTEETVLTTEELIKKGNHVMIITSGGQLAEFINKYHISGYVFDPKNNPCGQPRLGLGYMLFGPILLLHHLGYLNIDVENLKKSIDDLRKSDVKLQQIAIDIVKELKNQLVVLIGAEHLSGAVHIGRNQLNETAKTFAEYHLIPELNHHLLEGLAHPEDKKPFFLFYQSSLYRDRNQARFEITKKVLDKQMIQHKTITIEESEKITEFLKIMQINSYISFFLGIEYNLNPALIPWVDYFKSELQKT